MLTSARCSLTILIVILVSGCYTGVVQSELPSHSYVLDLQTNAVCGSSLFEDQQGVVTYRRRSCILSNSAFTPDFALRKLWLKEKSGSAITLALLECRGSWKSEWHEEYFTFDLSKTNLV